MPSYSKVLKSEQLDSVTQFSLSGLKEFSTPIKPLVNPTAETSVSEISEFNASSDSSTVESRSTSDRAGFVNLVTNQVTVQQGTKKQDAIHLWSVPEFQKEVSVKTGNPVQQKNVDYSHLLTEAKAQADEIISEADKNATSILAQAKAEAESLKQKAFMEGMNTARNEISQTMHQVERIFQESQLWQEQVMHQSQSRIIEMVLSIGKKLFGTGFELSADQVDHVVSRAINEASRLGNLRIYLHPEDAKLLVNLWQESEITLNGQQIQIVSSQNISRGGCFIDGQFGIVDGRVEEQIDQITASIKSAEVNLDITE